MGVDQEIEFILVIRLAQTADPLQGVLRPCLKICPSPFIIQISAHDTGKFLPILSALLITADILFDHDLIRQSLIRCLEDDLSEIAPRMQVLHRDEILQPVGISYKLLRCDMGVLYIEEITYCAHIDLQISPGVLFDRKRLLARLRQRHESAALFLESEEDLLFLLAADKEFFQPVLVQFPLAHIVVESLYPHIFIFQDLIEIS